MTKRIISLIIAMVLMVSIVAGCSSLGSQATTAATTKAATTAATTTAAGATTTAGTTTAAGATTTAGKVYTFKVAYGQPTSNPRHIAADMFKKWIFEQSKGRIILDLYPAEVLGTDKQMTEAVAMGTMDMTITASGVVATYEPKLAVFELPFLFSGYDKIGPILDGPIGTQIAASLPAKGMRLLAYWENGLRQITNNKRPIEKVDDLKGLKIRAPENKMTMSIFTTLGANPAPLSFPEVYLALSQGVFDGQENPIANIHSAKLYEVQKYITISNHKYECYPFVISEKLWQTLPKDIQDLLTTGALKFAKEHRRMVKEMEDAQLQDFIKAGMKVSKPDMKPFQDATKSVYAEWVPVFGQSLIDSVMAAAK